MLREEVAALCWLLATERCQGFWDKWLHPKALMELSFLLKMYRNKRK